MAFLFKTKNKTKQTDTTQLEAECNVFDEPLDRLIGGELPFGWYSHNKAFFEPRDNELLDLNLSAREAVSTENEAAFLERLIAYYRRYEEDCKDLGECYYHYFEMNYKHCHNSRNPDFEFIEPSLKRLDEIRGQSR